MITYSVKVEGHMVEDGLTLAEAWDMAQKLSVTHDQGCDCVYQVIKTEVTVLERFKEGKQI